MIAATAVARAKAASSAGLKMLEASSFLASRWPRSALHELDQNYEQALVRRATVVLGFPGPKSGHGHEGRATPQSQILHA